MPDSTTIYFKEPFSYGESILQFKSGGGNVYVLSDLHLAAGVNHNDNYEGTENFMADFSFARMIRHLQNQAGDKKHTLVINGDVIDFLRITSIPLEVAEFEEWRSFLSSIGIAKTKEELQACIIDRERKYGLETDDYKSVWKLMIAAKGHRPLINSLAAWVNDGHRLIITKGNHDLEWYWKAVRHALKMELCKSIHFATGAEMQKIAIDILDPRMFFADQALVIDDQVYCEHGHRFERFTTVDGEAVLENKKELNLPFGSFFNRYLINRIELAYPYIDNIRPRQQILSILLRERFPLAIKVLFSYLPFAVKVVPKKQYRYAFYFLFQFLMIIALPVGLTIYVILTNFHMPAESSGGIWKTILSSVKNLALLSLSYFMGRLFSWLQLSGPSSLSSFLPEILPTATAPSIITFGHTHNPEKLVTETNQHYFNTGTWMPVFEADSADIRIDKTYTVLCLGCDGNKFNTTNLMRWNDDALRLDILPLTERK